MYFPLLLILVLLLTIGVFFTFKYRKRSFLFIIWIIFIFISISLFSLSYILGWIKIPFLDEIINRNKVDFSQEYRIGLNNLSLLMKSNNLLELESSTDLSSKADNFKIREEVSKLNIKTIYLNQDSNVFTLQNEYIFLYNSNLKLNRYDIYQPLFARIEKDFLDGWYLLRYCDRTLCPQ